MKFALYFFSVLLFGFAIGCSRPSVTELPYEQAPDSAVIARIGDAIYTKGELERDVRIMVKLLEAAGFKQDEMTIYDDSVGYRRMILDQVLLREVVVQEAKRRGIALSASEMAEFQERFAGDFAQRIPFSFSAALTVLGTDATPFRSNLHKDALADKFKAVSCQRIAAGLPPVSREDAEARRKETLLHNSRLANENRLVGKLATNAWKSIRAGNDFDTVGRKLAEMRKEISFDANRADDSATAAKFANGAVPPPFAIPDGLVLAKARDSRHLAYVKFNFLTPRKVLSVEDQQAALQEKAVATAYRELLKKLKSQADISVLKL